MNISKRFINLIWLIGCYVHLSHPYYMYFARYRVLYCKVKMIIIVFYVLFQLSGENCRLPENFRTASLCIIPNI